MNACAINLEVIYIYIYIYKYILNSIALESIILLELGILSSWKHNIGPNSKVQHWFRHMDPPKKKLVANICFISS